MVESRENFSMYNHTGTSIRFLAVCSNTQLVMLYLPHHVTIITLENPFWLIVREEFREVPHVWNSVSGNYDSPAEFSTLPILALPLQEIPFYSAIIIIIIYRLLQVYEYMLRLFLPATHSEAWSPASLHFSPLFCSGICGLPLYLHNNVCLEHWPFRICLIYLT